MSNLQNTPNRRIAEQPTQQSSNSNIPIAPSAAVGAAAAVVSAFLRDPSVESKASKVAERLSENMLSLANEPSLAFYRIQEHVRKSVPQMVERKAAVDTANLRLEEACEDLHYGVKTISDLRKSTSHFANLADLLRHAAFYQQQLAHLHQQGPNRPQAASTAPIVGVMPQNH